MDPLEFGAVGIDVRGSARGLADASAALMLGRVAHYPCCCANTETAERLVGAVADTYGGSFLDGSGCGRSIVGEIFVE